MRQSNNIRNQNGNVFFLVLAGIVLFAALLFTFTKSSQKGTGNLSKQQAKIAAQEILNYAQLVEGAVNRVRQNGCSENEISFINDIIAGYTNTPDNKCRIFNSEGGRLQMAFLNKSWLDEAQATASDFKNYNFVGIGGVEGQQSSASDLNIVAPYLSQQVCSEINKSLNIDLPIPTDTNGIDSASKFVGSFDASPGASSIIGDAGTANAITNRHASACIHETAGCNGGACYHFYHILLPR